MLRLGCVDVEVEGRGTLVDLGLGGGARKGVVKSRSWECLSGAIVFSERDRGRRHSSSRVVEPWSRMLKPDCPWIRCCGQLSQPPRSEL